MRDIAVTILFIFLLFYTFRRPYIGVCAWIWISLAYPAGWAWGFSTNFRLNFTIALLTIFSYLIYKSKPKVKICGTSLLICLLWLIMLLSSYYTESLIKDFAWEKFSETSKVLLFYFMVVLTLDKKLHIDTFIWAVILSVSSFAGMEAVKFLASFGGHRINGFEGHVLGDRNDLAVAINMCIPLMIYLLSVTENKMVKIGLITLLIFNIIAVVGTYSRGGFIGLVILGGYFLLKSKRKFLWSMLTCIAITIAASSVPSEWKDRMNTVSSASTEDSSFIGRLWAWKISVKIANDNILGHGFFSTQDPGAWHKYRFSIDNFGFVDTPPVPDYIRPKAAHSIYFQVLSDFGYIGLFIYMLIMAKLFFRLKKLTKIAKEYDIVWVEKLTSMMMVALVGYCITGANVSMAYFVLYFAVIAIAYVLENRVIPREIANSSPQTQ